MRRPLLFVFALATTLTGGANADEWSPGTSEGVIVARMDPSGQFERVMLYLDGRGWNMTGIDPHPELGAGFWPTKIQWTFGDGVTGEVEQVIATGGPMDSRLMKWGPFPGSFTEAMRHALCAGDDELLVQVGSRPGPERLYGIMEWDLDGLTEALADAGSPINCPSAQPPEPMTPSEQRAADETAYGIISFLWLLYGGALCFLLAEKRGRRRWPWAVAGVFFTIPVVVALLILGKPQTKESGQPVGS